MKTLTLLMLFCTPSLAASFAYDGVLVEDGALVSGTRRIGVSLVNDTGAVVYTGVVHDTDVVDGRFFVLVGDVDDPPLDTTLLEQALAVQLTVDDVTLAPPQSIASVPRALTVDTSQGLAFSSAEGPGQTWRIEGDATSMRIVDVTAALQAPFVIEPGARSDAIHVRNNGDVGIGTDLPENGIHVVRSNNDATGITLTNLDPGSSAAARVRLEADSAVLLLQSHALARTFTRFGVTLGRRTEVVQQNGDGLIVGTLDARPMILGTNSLNRLEIGGTGGVTVTGNFTVSGGTKNFAMVDPADAKRAIYYSALEGPEVGTYVRGSVRLQGGTATVELPAHFARVTEPDAITVQLTPVGAFAQVYVSEKSARRIVIRAAPGSTGDVDVDWLVQGVRKGHKEFAVERANDLPR